MHHFKTRDFVYQVPKHSRAKWQKIFRIRIRLQFFIYFEAFFLFEDNSVLEVSLEAAFKEKFIIYTSFEDKVDINCKIFVIVVS